MIEVKTNKEKQKTLKIAIFSGSIPSTTFIEHLINGISEYHEILLFGRLKSKMSYAAKAIKIYDTPTSHRSNLVISTYRLFLLLLKRPKDVFKLLKEIKQYSSLHDRWIWFTKFLPIVLYKPDILHIQWARNLEFYYFLKRDFGIKIILSLRGAHINYSPITNKSLAQIYKQTFPKIDAFHAVSEAIGLEAEKYNAPKNKITVIHSPVPQKFLNSYKPYNKSSRGPIKLISVGRTHWIKGYGYAIDAIAKLRTRGFNIEYSIIGADKINEALNFQIKQTGMDDHIKLLPSIPQNELIKQFSSYHALILSSLKEGIANVVLEAMAIGLPVISTNCGGMSEVVRHQKTGYLVPIRDSDAIANSIIELTKATEEELNELTQNAHDFVAHNFNASDKINDFLALYSIVARYL